MSAEEGIWAYAIADSDRVSASDLSWLTGVGGARVRTAGCSGLTMLVSEVSLAEFGEAALRRNLENLQWLDEVAQAHHHVIDAAARLFPVLPTRLATVYTGDAAACAALDDRRDRLRAALRRIAGHVEWGVKAYAAPQAQEADREPAAGRGDGKSGAGLAYLRRRRDQLAAGREAQTAAARGARELHASLADQATAAVVRPPQAAQLGGVRQPMLLNAAYLLGAGEQARFTAAVAAGASAHPELRVELTGPWPPYSFAGGDDDGR